MGRYDIDDREMLETFSKTLTYDELLKEVNDEFESMCDDEKYFRIVHNDPTFKQQILTSMKEGQTVELNEFTCEFKISK